jgi:hypothetical protein
MAAGAGQVRFQSCGQYWQEPIACMVHPGYDLTMYISWPGSWQQLLCDQSKFRAKRCNILQDVSQTGG